MSTRTAARPVEGDRLVQPRRRRGRRAPLLVFGFLVVAVIASSCTITVDAIGDGGPSSGNWTTAFGTRIAADNPAYFLWLGDVRNSGTAAEWTLYHNVYGRFNAITIPTPGNHDWPNHASGYDPVFKSDPNARTARPWCNRIMTGNGWALISVNTYTKSSCASYASWMAAPGKRKIVLTHEPRYSGATGHGSDAGQQDLWGPMVGHAFALVSGHDHDGEVIQPPGQGGLLQIVAGCAGAQYFSVSPIAGELFHTTSAANCTYARLSLGDTSAKVEMVTSKGTVAYSKSIAVS